MKIIVLAATLLVAPAIANCQDQAIPGGGFKVAPLRIPIDELRLFYEKPVSPLRSVEYEAGLIYPSPLLRNFLVDFFSSPYFFYRGVLAGAGLRKYSASGWYTQFSAVYKFRFFNREKLWYGGMGGSSYADEELLSRQQHVLRVRCARGYQPADDPHDISFALSLSLFVTRSTVYGSRIRGGEGYPDPVGQPNPDAFPSRDWDFALIPLLEITYKVGRGRKIR